jgi:hypothetical protein
MAFVVPVKKQDDGSVIFPPFRSDPWHVLAVIRKRVRLNEGHSGPRAWKAEAPRVSASSFT